ncbi:hypothetical protein RF11_06867 [Thelohanellus kitauei]|uniref:Uncharacterized protein n=1 Tax=Thelohanellus kitauei TaxID=669202 RepID=A0A0C2M5A5_THEKT|nr:hypothetical protein RF11_06867 [Thelohanellus kitauei]
MNNDRWKSEKRSVVKVIKLMEKSACNGGLHVGNFTHLHANQKYSVRFSTPLRLYQIFVRPIVELEYQITKFGRIEIAMVDKNDVDLNNLIPIKDMYRNCASYRRIV